MKKKLGILGGVGTLASLYFVDMLTQRTNASCDQDYIDFVLLNHASMPDRTSYILNNDLENPMPYIKDDLLKLQLLGCDYICITCNTSFYFEEEIKKTTNIPVYNIIKETVKHAKSKYSKALLLSTEGTLKSGLYQKYLDKYNMEYICLNDQMQSIINDIIYKKIKVGKKISLKEVNKVIEYGKELGCDCVILGCTELSMLKTMLKLDNSYIEPLELMADKVLKEFGKERI